MSRSPRSFASAVAQFVATVLVGVGLGVGVPLVVAPGVAVADQTRDQEWQLWSLDAAAAWSESTGANVTVAVLDSGVDATHPDLVGQVLPGVDFVDAGGNGQSDPVGHGTTVASLIAGRHDDADGVEGLAPDAKILPVRVLDAQNRYDDAVVIAKGVQWAVDHGARVINLSLGGAAYSAALADALDYAFARDVVVVACTGNVLPNEPTEVWYPAREPGVVAVTGLDFGSGSASGPESGSESSPESGPGADPGSGAGPATGSGPAADPDPAAGSGPAGSGPAGSDPAGSGPAGSNPAAGTEPDLWSYSLTGRATVLSAPATNLLGAEPGGTYWRVQGTSFSAPMVSATAALIRARWPGMSAANVVQRLVQTARDLGRPGRDDRYGFGLVDPVRALQAAVPEVNSNPLDTAPPPGLAGFGPADPGPADPGPVDTGPADKGPADKGPAAGPGAGPHAGPAGAPLADGHDGRTSRGTARSPVLPVLLSVHDRSGLPSVS